MGDGTDDPGTTVLTVGQRIRLWRKRRGMSRDTLAGLVGRSPSWLKQVEYGNPQAEPLLSLLPRLAEALHVRDLVELTGDQAMPIRMFSGPSHCALGDVKRAFNLNPLLQQTRGPAQSLDALRGRLDSAWRTRHASPDHRTALGKILPDLLRDGQYAAGMYEGVEQRRAKALLAEVYGLTQMFVAYQPAADLLWRVADRALLAAREAEDPMALACAIWFYAQAHRDNGDYEAAYAINEVGMSAIQPHMENPSVDLLAMWGALSFELAYTAARSGETEAAWRHWSDAQRVAERLPADYYQPWTSFSRVIMKAHAVTVAVELHQGEEAARHADNGEGIPIPSRPRRGRHLIEVARAHQLGRDFDAVLGTLRLAHQAAPETIRYNGFAKCMALELVEIGPSYLRAQAHQLADHIGLLV
ncbi:helix-turn-helix domain-containing protein [Nonomuraea sp. NPDC004702]